MHKRKKRFCQDWKINILLHNALYNNAQNILQITNFAFAIPCIMIQLLQCKQTKLHTLRYNTQTRSLCVLKHYSNCNEVCAFCLFTL